MINTKQSIALSEFFFQRVHCEIDCEQKKSIN